MCFGIEKIIAVLVGTIFLAFLTVIAVSSRTDAKQPKNEGVNINPAPKENVRPLVPPSSPPKVDKCCCHKDWK